jgi:hypothetical protein
MKKLLINITLSILPLLLQLLVLFLFSSSNDEITRKTTIIIAFISLGLVIIDIIDYLIEKIK